VPAASHVSLLGNPTKKSGITCRICAMLSEGISRPARCDGALGHALVVVLRRAVAASIRFWKYRRRVCAISLVLPAPAPASRPRATGSGESPGRALPSMPFLRGAQRNARYSASPFSNAAAARRPAPGLVRQLQRLPDQVLEPKTQCGAHQSPRRRTAASCAASRETVTSPKYGMSRLGTAVDQAPPVHAVVISASRSSIRS